MRKQTRLATTCFSEKWLRNSEGRFRNPKAMRNFFISQGYVTHRDTPQSTKKQVVNKNSEFIF